MAQQAQSDPWVEAAKNFKADPQGESAPAGGNDDWKVWQHNGEQPQSGGLIKAFQNEADELSATHPHTSDMSPFQHVGTGLANIGAGALGTVLQPIAHPIKTLQSIGRMIPIGEAADAFSGQPTAPQELGHALRENPAQTIEQGVGGIAAGEGLGMAKEGIAKLPQSIRPTPSSSVVSPAEMASRKLSAAVLPATKDASNFINAAPLEVPNVLDYAKRNNNPLNTQLEFSKAAQGNAQEARNFYQDQVLKPNDKLVDTTGSGFGDRAGEGPKTTAKLSDIDRRITEINKQLDQPALNSDDARRALASKTGLQAEAGRLRDILHQSLGEATGLQPEDIANLRQRVGRSYELGNDADAAVTERMQNEGQRTLGKIHFGEVPSFLLEKMRGGPTAIADRQFQRAIKGFPGEAQPLPKVTMQPPAEAAPARPPMWANSGIEPGQAPVQPLTSSPEAAQGLTKALQEKRGAINAKDQAIQDQVNKMDEPIRQIRAANLQRKLASIYRQE